MTASEMARALLLAIDPAAVLSLPNPHPGQQRIIAEAQRFNVIAAGRRWGKNTLAEGRVVLPALQGKPVAWFSPTYKTLSDDWRRLLEIARPVLIDKSEQERRMVLRGGGVVEMWSLEDPDTARGRAYARVVVDEAASIPHFMYAWQQVIRPMLADFSGDAWFISTPAGLNDFYTLYQWGQDPEGHPEWRSWQRPSSENPHLKPEELSQAERDSPVRVWQEEWLAKFLPGGIGQYFDEWDTAVHLCKPFDIPKEWRTFGMLDYGYDPDPLCYLQIALSPTGQGFVYREIYRTHVIDSDQAALIADACAGDAPECIVAGPDLWNKSGKGPRGQSSAETYEQAWRERGFSTRLKKADNNRIMGWRRVHEWLKPYPAPDQDPASGSPRVTARLQVFEGRCPNLVRTLPLLVHDDGKPQDVKTDSEDHAADALRYGLMSRPAPKPLPQRNPAGDFEAAAMLKEVERRRRVAAKGYIGNAMDPWSLNYQRYYGPSER